MSNFPSLGMPYRKETKKKIKQNLLFNKVTLFYKKVR